MMDLKRKLYYTKVKWLNEVYPEENYTSFHNYWEDHASEFPRRADVETTPFCDARCTCCLANTMTKPRGIMTLETFKTIAAKLKNHNCLIRGMYTTGNPLLDPTLFEKYAYARKIGVMAPYVSLNTTTSLLTPELYKKILDNTDNITLSFFNVGTEFERLTGLNWKLCYDNALQFIRFRDRYKPEYRVFIGCNPVQDSNLKAVQKAFKPYHVEYAIDAELRWAGKVISGVIDRSIMHPFFRCDGHEGVLLVKWDGKIEACSYDFKEETLYANILTDDWETIRQTFFKRWVQPFTLCARCDYWHKYWKVKHNHFRNVTHDKWQRPFLKEGEKYQK